MVVTKSTVSEATGAWDIGWNRTVHPESPSVASMAQLRLCERHADHAFQPQTGSCQSSHNRGTEERRKGYGGGGEEDERRAGGVPERAEKGKSPCGSTQQFSVHSPQTWTEQWWAVSVSSRLQGVVVCLWIPSVPVDTCMCSSGCLC